MEPQCPCAQRSLYLLRVLTIIWLSDQSEGKSSALTVYLNRATSKRFVSGFSLFRIGSKYFQKMSSSFIVFSFFNFSASIANNSNMFIPQNESVEFRPTVSGHGTSYAMQDVLYSSRKCKKRNAILRRLWTWAIWLWNQRILLLKFVLNMSLSHPLHLTVEALNDYDMATYFGANMLNIFITLHCICIGAVLLLNHFLTKLVFICCITSYKCK